MREDWEDHKVRGIGICVDYDETFTTNKPVWTAVINFLREQGANVFCISLRYPNCPITDFPGDVYYAAGQPKWQFAEENGIDVHIWVDDWPTWIGEDPKRRGLKPPQMIMREKAQAA